MAYETFELVRLLIDTVGDKRLSEAAGYRRETLHRMARHPADVDEPDGTGAPNTFDRLERMLEATAVRPGGRAALRVVRLWTDEVFDRLLNGYEAEPLTDCRLVKKTGDALREFSELLTVCASLDDLNPKAVVKEGTEAVEAIERLVRAASVGVKERRVA